MIRKITAGEIEDTKETAFSAAAQVHRLGGKKCAEYVTPKRQSEIAKMTVAK